MTRERFLVVHGVTAEQWARRYDIEPFSHPCSKCGRTCETTIPFAHGTLRGLMSPPCECGNELTPYGFVRDPAYGDLFTGREALDSNQRASRRTARQART